MEAVGVLGCDHNRVESIDLGRQIPIPAIFSTIIMLVIVERECLELDIGNDDHCGEDKHHHSGEAWEEGPEKM
jgi:hypothetical protein